MDLCDYRSALHAFQSKPDLSNVVNQYLFHIFYKLGAVLLGAGHWCESGPSRAARDQMIRSSLLLLLYYY